MYIQNKLFSETGERYYSVIMTEREFSLWTRMKDKIRNKLQRSIVSDTMKIDDMEKTITKSSKVSLDKPLTGSILRTGKSITNSELHPKPSFKKSPFCMEKVSEDMYQDLEKSQSDDDYTKDEKDFMFILMSDHDSNKNSIFWDESDGIEAFAHEVGHLLKTKANIKDWMIKQGIHLSKRLEKSSNSSIRALLSVISNQTLVWEEKRASEKGYKFLKGFNLSPSDLKQAKENLDLAIKHYKLKRNQKWKLGLRDSKILSR